VTPPDPAAVRADSGAGDWLVLIAPAANRVYAQEADRLVAAELQILLGAGSAHRVRPVTLAGVGYVKVDAGVDESALLTALGRLSGFLAAFRDEGGRLRPVAVSRPDLLGDDLVSIPKYSGKTNEQFTRLLLNVTLASTTRQPGGPGSVLDPLCGRGTTLSTALTLGYDAAGVETDLKAVEAYAAYLTSYLRRHRLKHSIAMHPVRRDGKSLGRRIEAEVRPERAERPLGLTVFSGDTRHSAALFGRRRFDAVVADAPYGVVHGSHPDRRGTKDRDRSPGGLLGEALPVWAGQLKHGGALGLSWNTHGLARQQLVGLVTAAGLEPLGTGPYADLGHRVDSAIYRDVLVATKP
jgi:SAM-dependent methyltransferase